MTLVSLVPFILLILVIVMVSKKREDKTRVKKQLSRKLVLTLLSLYGVILIIGSILFLLIPSGSQSAIPQASSSEIQKARLASHELDQAIVNGRVNQLKGVSIKKAWTFAYKGRRLTVASNNHSSVIYVKHKETNDGSIEVKEYRTKTYVDHLDLSKRIPAPTLTLNGETLTASNPERLSLKVIYLASEPTMTQFNKNKADRENAITFNTNFVLGRHILYIEVPRDVKVTGKLLQFVN